MAAGNDGDMKIAAKVGRKIGNMKYKQDVFMTDICRRMLV